MSRAGKKLNAKGITIPRRRNGAGGTPRVGHFTAMSLYRILTNQAYVARYRSGGC
jgi:hypothetical protein